MPVEKKANRARKREPRRFPPSLAGSCLRYAVMDVLGFGRLIDPESQAAMRAGSLLHKQFQQELLDAYAMCSVEVVLRDDAWGVSGRMDALIETPAGPAVIEYKTVSTERFQRIQEAGPLVSHWSQLQLYMAVGSLAQGTLVVDDRSTGNRLIFRTDPDPHWAEWLSVRLSRVKEFQAARKLPEREVSQGCLSCDRWQRCFKTEDDRQRAVGEHPVWEPDPPVPERTEFSTSEEIVS